MPRQAPDGGRPRSDAAVAPAGSSLAPEQQLAKEKEARVVLRDRLRAAESLAAESQALRAKMSEEMARMSGEIGRLRAAAADPAQTSAPSKQHASPLPALAPPPSGPRAGWLALGLVAGVALGLGAATGLAWWQSGRPGDLGASWAAWTERSGSMHSAATAGRGPMSASALPATTDATIEGAPTSAAATPPAGTPDAGAVAALGASSPEALLAAMPTAAGGTRMATSATATGLAARLLSALANEGVTAPVALNTSTGLVAVSDPTADNGTRDRTDTVIRAVFAGASLPEPLIEHRWFSPSRAGRTLAPASLPTWPAALSDAALARHRLAARSAAARALSETADAAPEVPPAGRLTAACRASVTPGTLARRSAQMMSCMRQSCCNTGSPASEECQAFDRHHPLSCPAG